MLQTKQVGQYTVSQAGMIHAIRRANLFKEFQQNAANYDSEMLSAMAAYPLIAGCVSPLISVDEFMQMPEQELDALTVAVMELNPHWFELPDQEKKTETPQPESTSDSETS